MKHGNWSMGCAVALMVQVIFHPALGATLTWTGASSRNWNTNDSNWGGPLWNNTTPDSAVFGATGVGQVNLTTAITANTITFNTAGYTVASNTLTLGGTTPSITNNADATISSVLAGTAGLTKQGTAKLTISGNNTFTGNVALGDTSGGINGGSLKLASSGALGTGSKTVYVRNGSTFVELDGSAGAIALPSGVGFYTSGTSIRNLAGSNTISGQIYMTTGAGDTTVISDGSGTLTLAGTVTAGGGNRTLILAGTSTNGNRVSGVINNGSGTGVSVTKSGAGTWQLAGANTYKGNTTVSGGTLILSGSLQSSNVNVTAGTLASQGAPGTTGNLNLAAGSGYQVRVMPSGADRLTVDGTVTLAGSLELIPSPGLAGGASLVILQRTSAGPISGTFAGLAEGAQFSAGGYNWQITYNGGDGNDVVLTREPGALQTFEERRAQILEALRGQPFVQGYISPSPAYRRPESYTYMNFALRCFMNDEQLDEANHAVAAFCNQYADNQYFDNVDWMSDMAFCILENYGSQGRTAPGKLYQANEDALFNLFWQYAKRDSDLIYTSTATTNIWSVANGTENLNAMNIVTLWHAAKLLRKHPAYTGLLYDNGISPETYYQASTAYYKEWLRERARKGMLVEFESVGYNPVTVKGIYNFVDFAEDTELRELARKWLDLFWAKWGQEQLDGVKGGGKARVYQGEDSMLGLNNPFSDIFWCYSGLGQVPVPVDNVLTYLSSSYRPSAVAADIASDQEGRGTFVSIERKMGRAIPGTQNIDTNNTFARYAYTTPDYILGTFHVPDLRYWDWQMISSQNRWHGAIFKGHPDARIFFQCSVTPPGNLNYNQHWSVQSRNAIIVQKLNNAGTESTRHAKYADAMKVWVAAAGRSNLVERAGWVFASYGSAYAGIKVVDGGFTWTNDPEPAFSGQWMVLNKEYSPVVMEVARALEYTNFTAFQDRILSNSLSLVGSTLTYQSSLGDVLTLYTNYSASPKVNGVTLDYKPAKAYDSPFVSGTFNSGVVAVQKDGRSLTLDFGTQIPVTNFWRAGNNVWDTSARNWNNGTAAWANTGGERAVFEGTPGTVVLTPAIYPAGLTFNTNTVLTGAPLWLLGPDPSLAAASGVTARLDNSLSGWVGFSKSGPGTLVLNGTNDYLGGTRILSGTLQVGNGGTSGTPGTGLITNAAALVVNRAGTVVFPSTISGPGSFSIQNPAVADTVVLAASNNFTGSLTLSRGTLRLADSAALGGVARTLTLDATNTLVELGGDAPVEVPATVSFTASGASLANVSGDNRINGSLDLGASGATVGSVAGSLTLAGNISGGSTARTLELAGASTSSNLVSGLISDGSQPTALLKSGSGTWQLDGAQPYTGLTTVADGTLVIGGSLAGSVNVTNGALAAAGEAPMAGDLSIGSGGTYEARPNAAVAVSGTISLSGNLSANFPRGILVGSSFVILRKSGPGLLGSTFAGLAEGQTFTASGYDWTITYAGGDGNDVAITSLTGPANALEAWRHIHFGFYSNTGVAADTADPDGDSLTNIQEYGQGTDPNDVDSPYSFIWTRTAGGAWTTATNWNLNLAPPSNPARRLEFFTGAALPASPIAITNNNAGNFLLHQLTLGGEATSTNRVVLSGGTLDFRARGTNPPALVLPPTSNAASYTVSNSLILVGSLSITATQGGNAVLSGVLSGPGGITFTGSGTNLVLAANNTYAGTTRVISGYYPGTITPFWSTLQIGNGGSSGTPGTGPIVNDGTLRFNRSGTLRLANVISGTGNLLLDNPSSTDTLILSGSNTFSGGVTIAKGRLVVSNSFALGINGKIINATTGQGGIDLNPGAGSINLDPDIYFTLSGSPSGGTLRNVTGNNIINGQIGAATGAGGSLITSEDGSLTLAGPVQTVNSGGRTITFAGTSTGANLVSGEMADGISTLTITKSGTGLWIFSGANSYTGPTTVSAGTLRIRHDTALGDTSTNTTVATGAKLQLEGVSLHVAEDFVLGTGTTGAIVENVSGDNTLSGSITRNGALTFLATGGKLTILSGIGDTTNALNLQGNGDGELRGAITAADALAKTGAGTWTLFGTNTFVAPATISGGTLRVSGSLANGAVTVSGGTLGGQGTINGPVTVSSGALEPGASSNLNEALTIKNHLVLGSTARFQIGKSGSTPVCDRVISVTNVTYGGTLVVTNVTGATWVGGETFNLFSASGTKSGNFTNVVLQPAVAGVVPSFNPANGTLSLAVITPPTLNVSQLGGGTLQLSWSGSFKLQSQTNTLSVGLGSNWSDYPGGGSSPVSVTPDLTKGSVFFRLSQ